MLNFKEKDCKVNVIGEIEVPLLVSKKHYKLLDFDKSEYTGDMSWKRNGKIIISSEEKKINITKLLMEIYQVGIDEGKREKIKELKKVLEVF